VAIDQVSVQLIRRCQQEGPGAFDELFELIQEDLYRWIYSIVRSPDETDEIFQETCVRIYRHLKRLKDPEKFPAWVSRIVVNQSNTHRTRSGRMRTVSLEESIEVPNEALVAQSTPAPDARQEVYRKEVLEEVNTAIRELPPRQRTAVLLFDVENYSIKEIASLLECSEGAVKFNIHQGRRKLRELLAHHVEDLGDRKVIE
jgi:RNA polymerase sigma-70 factor (ECF subfamily)